MGKDSVKKLLDLQESVHRQLETFSAAMKAIEADSGFQRTINQANRSRELIRAALGPFEELRLSGAVLKFGAECQRIGDMVAETEKRFRLPEFDQAAKLLRELENSDAAKMIARFQKSASEFQRAMEAMRAPWLDMQNRIQSITGFVKLQGIGQALRTMSAFDTTLADRLRINLGDWREKINWPAGIFTDPLARTGFYIKRGLDPTLTAFPVSAFDQSITIAGIKRAPSPFIDAYASESEAEEDEEEAGFTRTNAAHDRLQRFESQMRKFIDERMTAAFGEDWIKHHVPGKIRKTWYEKLQKAEENREAKRPLISYADFTDYVPIITRKDKWLAVFQQVFKRVPLVQESFQRLYPIRICTMHARIITQDDELYLYAETKRVLRHV